MKGLVVLLVMVAFSSFRQIAASKKEYYPNGELMCETVVNPKGEIHEKWYSLEGQLHKIYTIVENRHNGPFIEYFKHGSIKMYGFYKANKKDSTWVVYYPSGMPKAKGNYISEIRIAKLNHEMDSVQILNEANDVVNSYQLFSNTLDSLILYYFDDSYPVVFPLTYSLKDGIWNYMDENGNITRQEHWDRGDLIQIKNY